MPDRTGSDCFRLTVQPSCCRIGWRLHNHVLLLSSRLMLRRLSQLLRMPRPTMPAAPPKLALELAWELAEAAEARVLELQREAREHAAAAGQAFAAKLQQRTGLTRTAEVAGASAEMLVGRTSVTRRIPAAPWNPPMKPRYCSRSSPGWLRRLTAAAASALAASGV